MFTLFKNTPLSAFAPERQALLLKLQDSCQAWLVESGYEPEKHPTLKSASLRADSFWWDVFQDSEVEALLTAENLDFIAAYALEDGGFDSFWMFLDESCSHISAITLSGDRHHQGMASLLRRIPLEDSKRRLTAVSRLLDVMEAQDTRQSEADTPFELCRLDLHVYAENCLWTLFKQPGKTRLPFQYYNDVCQKIMAPIIAPDLMRFEAQVFREALCYYVGSKSTAREIELLIDAVIYNSIAVMVAGAVGVADIVARLEPVLEVLLEQICPSPVERKAVSRQVLINGLSVYPELLEQMQPTTNEMLGRHPHLVSNPTLDGMIRTLSGPFGVYSNGWCEADIDALRMYSGEGSVVDLYDSHLTRAHCCVHIPLITANQNTQAIEQLLRVDGLFHEAVCHKWKVLDAVAPEFDDKAYMTLIRHHTQALVDDEDYGNGFDHKGGRQLLAARPHLMPEVIDMLAQHAQRGVDSELLSRVARLLDVETQLLLNHQAFQTNHTFRATTLAGDLGL